MRATCDVCGEVIPDADRPGTYQYVEGWEERRSQGGTNAVRARVPHPRFAHPACIDALVRGLLNAQELW